MGSLSLHCSLGSRLTGRDDLTFQPMAIDSLQSILTASTGGWGVGGGWI